MLLREACLLLGLLSVCLATTADLRQQNQGETADSELKQKAANSKLLNVKADASKYFFNVTNGDDVLALLKSSGAWKMELVQVTKTGLKSYKPKQFANMSGDLTVTGARESKDAASLVNLVITYKGAETDNFNVKSATVKLSISTSGISSVKRDYWNMLSASLTTTYALNGTDTTVTDLDVTPRAGYGPNKADVSCSNGYSVCAPLPLSWTCTDQTLKKVNNYTEGADTVILHIPGLSLKPFKSGDKSPKFGYNWDCDPLISIPIWTSLFVTLGLASILLYALVMVASIYTPSKYDDPKGPSISVPQSD